MNNVLITGGAGFIGSNFVRYWLEHYPQDKVFNLDALTYAGNLGNLQGIAEGEHYSFIHGDICDESLMDKLFADYDFDVVVHFAAESHVDRSILGPESFLQTNIIGTFRLLEAAKKYWANADGSIDQSRRFIHVSTDEVFGTLGPDDPKFCETTCYAPTSPYSASKASSDHLAMAYYHTYGLPVMITNCSNNYGPYQFPEKLIPLFFINAMEGKSLPIYGDGLQIRDWLYVDDHCSGIATVAEKGRVGETYNIGGNNEWANIDIVKKVCDYVDEKTGSDKSAHDLITYVKDRPGHDRRYAIDSSKIMGELNWAPAYDFERGIKVTLDWYFEHMDWMNDVRSGAYKEFYDQQYRDRK